MCELMTIAAALAFTALHFVGKRRGPATLATMLMFWGAALMWGVDCVANRLEGGPLLDLSRADAVLGFIILGAGLLVYAALEFIGHRRSQA